MVIPWRGGPHAGQEEGDTVAGTFVEDLTLRVDVAPGGAMTALWEGWPEDGRLLLHYPLPQSFAAVNEVLLALQKAFTRKTALATPFSGLFRVVQDVAQLDACCGAVLCEWLLPPGSTLRATVLHRCVAAAQRESRLRLWLSLDARLTSDLYVQNLEREVRATWEGLWVREWADPAMRPPTVCSPFLALNPWLTLVRRPPGVQVARRVTVPGKVNVLVVISNPPTGVQGWRHIAHLERADGSGMVRRVWRPFMRHRSVGWVYPARNPTKVRLAQCIRDHKPHIVVYLGHGYAHYDGAGVVLATTEAGQDFARVSGVRREPERESELEQVLAGKAEALRTPGTPDAGLPTEERPRLVLAFACEAAPAAPALLQCGVPAVLAMRRPIPDSTATEAMIAHCIDVLTDETQSLETALVALRQFLKAQEPHFADERLHFSVPVLHLGTTGTPAHETRR